MLYFCYYTALIVLLITSNGDTIKSSIPSLLVSMDAGTAELNTK